LSRAGESSIISPRFSYTLQLQIRVFTAVMPEKDQKTKKSTQRGFPYQKPGPTVLEFTPQARKIWHTIPVEGRTKILNTVWCVNCSRFTTMVSYSGKSDSQLPPSEDYLYSDPEPHRGLCLIIALVAELESNEKQVLIKR
jgi:hypothetical protein